MASNLDENVLVNETLNLESYSNQKIASARIANETLPQDCIEPQVTVPLEKENIKFPWIDWKVLWKYAGPGWLVSISYLDPGNLEADLQDGAYANYSLLWVLLLSTIFALLLQLLAARMGVVTGYSLAQNIVLQYNSFTRYVLWAMIEIAIIGADVQEVIGAAIAWQIITGVPLWGGVLITTLDTFLFMGLHMLGMQYLEGFVLSMVLTVIICFNINLVQSGPPAGPIFRGMVDFTQTPSYAIPMAVGTIGSVITPHNFYLHSGLVRSRKIDRTNEAHLCQANKYNAIESSLSMFVSFVINVIVVCVFAVQFFDSECAAMDNPDAPFCRLPYLNTEQACQEEEYIWISSKSVCCGNIGLATAGSALQVALGNAGLYIWAIGLLAAGQASTLSCSLAGQITMEGFWNIRVKQWQRLLLTRCITLVPTLIVGVVATTSSSIVNQVNSGLNILMSVQLPFVLIPVISITSNQEAMGKFANSTFIKTFCWLMAVALISINIYGLVELMEPTSSPGFWLLYGIGFCIYAEMIFYVSLRDWQKLWKWVVG